MIGDGLLVRLLKTQDEVDVARSEAYLEFRRNIERYGLTPTPEAEMRWWGIGQIKQT